MKAQPQLAGQPVDPPPVQGKVADATGRDWLASTTEAERLRLFILSVTDYAIFMLSPEGTVASWNAGAQRFKGYSADEIIGQHFSRFYTEEDRAAGIPEKALQQARDTGKFEAEGWRVRKDGSRFWAQVVIDPIRNEQGELVGFAKITRDITERRNAAIELEQAREALLQSQKMEAIGQLTGGVAHDFNNLLNVVTHGITMLRSRLNDAADVRLLDAMDQAADRGAQLTHQLLSFARQQPLRPTPCDVNQLITSFEAVLRRASRKTIHFELKLGTDLPLVMVDSAQFEAALLNLVVNARDATPGDGLIRLSTQAVALNERQARGLQAGPYVAVSVQDTGTGMPPEVVARAVDPFFTTKEVGKGTGLGLSQVYGTVRQSGGDLRIESRVGKGTSITMLFPAAPGDAQLEQVAQADAAVDAGEAWEDSGGKVLIVDDKPEVLEVTAELFRTLGFEVVSAKSGMDALEILERMPDVRLMLSDLLMPGLTGIQLGRKARALIPSLKVILASGYANPAAAKETGRLDGFHFLQKPYRIDELLKLLRAL